MNRRKFVTISSAGVPGLTLASSCKPSAGDATAVNTGVAMKIRMCN
jgi:hypothetical protein